MHLQKRAREARGRTNFELCAWINWLHFVQISVSAINGYRKTLRSVKRLNQIKENGKAARISFWLIYSASRRLRQPTISVEKFLGFGTEKFLLKLSSTRHSETIKYFVTMFEVCSRKVGKTWRPRANKKLETWQNFQTSPTIDPVSTENPKSWCGLTKLFNYTNYICFEYSLRSLQIVVEMIKQSSSVWLSNYERFFCKLQFR